MGIRKVHCDCWKEVARCIATQSVKLVFVINRRLKINTIQKKSVLVAGVILSLLVIFSQHAVGVGLRGAGRAIISGKTGDAFVRYPQQTAHQYPQGLQEVDEGDAFTDGHIISTDSDGRLCIVLTPGAVLCMAGDSSVELNSLREMAQGLPSNEQDVVRTIDLSMKKGAVLFYGGQPSPNNRFKITLPDGVVETSGATFECAHENGRWKLIVRDGTVIVQNEDGRYPVASGETGHMDRVHGKPRVRVSKTTTYEKSSLDGFELCEELYTFLEPLVFRVDGVDVDGVADFVGGGDGLTLFGNPTAWADVSPSQPLLSVTRAAETRQGQPWKRGRLLSREQIWNWYRDVGTIKGVNYIPRNAVNAIEMWQVESFDPELIDEELGWAQDVGYGAVRVPLSFTVWRKDPDAYLDRIERFLDIASRKKLSTAFVLMDDTRRSEMTPRVGPQPAPISGVYNSQWVPSPGPEYVSDRSRWDEVERYIRGVISTFKTDKRVLFWDMYHTPGNDNLWDKTLPLLESSFSWARDEDPVQPLTAGPWTEYASPMSVRIMELSDFISLQTFDGVEGVKAKLRILSQFNRPIICTDWLKRQNGNTFSEILPLFAENDIGWFNRGLVRGKTQLHYPDDSIVKGDEEIPWQQNILKEDGSAYNDEEIRQIRAFDFD